MINTRIYICETCTHESVCKYAKEMKDLEDMLNERLKSRGHLFLNEVYDMLGAKRTKAVSDLKDLKDMASVKVTCRNRTLQYYTTKADTACRSTEHLDGIIRG